MFTNVLYAIKELTVPALSSMLINTKYKGVITKMANPITTIFTLHNPTISGMPPPLFPLTIKLQLQSSHWQLHSICHYYHQKQNFRGFQIWQWKTLATQWWHNLCSNFGHSPKVSKSSKKSFTREETEKKVNLQVPIAYKKWYINILYKHQSAIKVNKFDLGQANNFTHETHLKDKNPVYRKQFKIPEAY